MVVYYMWREKKSFCELWMQELISTYVPRSLSGCYCLNSHLITDLSTNWNIIWNSLMQKKKEHLVHMHIVNYWQVIKYLYKCFTVIHMIFILKPKFNDHDELKWCLHIMVIKKIVPATIIILLRQHQMFVFCFVDEKCLYEICNILICGHWQMFKKTPTQIIQLDVSSMQV